MKELDAMKSVWQNDESGGETPVLDFLVRKVKRDETSALQRRTRWSPIGDLVVGSIMLFLVGNFGADNIQALIATPVAAIPAALVFALEVFVIHLAVRQLILSSSLDYAKPILEAQAQLAQLRKLRLHATQWTFVFGFSAWVIFPLLLGQMLVGVNFISSVPTAWILANIVFALAMIPIILWIVRRSRFAGSLQDAIVGKHILEAENFLQDIQSFKTP